ncbi:hypothetical protein FB45DRAFT_873325 [Roridomyces roridus]|uniref:Uncharacterized protein n=1 Tax=Roridomyces roridus TaxID=1738132 RepID=A0AAD7FCN7_9AGAR|nr:hypothetical protein FB45DRAFT_873325 [Roridomyces roridus]
MSRNAANGYSKTRGRWVTDEKSEINHEAIRPKEVPVPAALLNPYLVLTPLWRTQQALCPQVPGMAPTWQEFFVDVYERTISAALCQDPRRPPEIPEHRAGKNGDLSGQMPDANLSKSWRAGKNGGSRHQASEGVVGGPIVPADCIPRVNWACEVDSTLKESILTLVAPRQASSAVNFGNSFPTYVHRQSAVRPHPAGAPMRTPDDPYPGCSRRPAGLQLSGPATIRS